jgi:hypothetical protein
MSPEERRRLLEQLPPATPLTLERAAWLANYRSVSALRTAMRHGRLRVTRHSPRSIVTTAGDVLEYLHTVNHWGAPRGQPRRHKTQEAGDQDPSKERSRL